MNCTYGSCKVAVSVAVAVVLALAHVVIGVWYRIVLGNKSKGYLQLL